MRIARYIDYDEGSLVLLTEDFCPGRGRIVEAGGGFSWWCLGEDRVGFSFDRLDREEDLESSLPPLDDYRVLVPQFRLFNAGVREVLGASRTYFVEKDNGSFAAEAYLRAISSSETGGSLHSLYEWVCLYHLFGHPDGLYWMSCSFLELNMPGEAIRWLTRYLDICPDDSWAHRQLGCAFLLLGEHERTRTHWRRALALERAGGSETDAAELLAVLGKKRELRD